MNKTRIFITLFCIFILSSPALGWDNVNSHPNMTNKAADFLISEDARYDFYADYIHFNIATDTQLTFMDEGAVKEDYGTGPDWDEGKWGSQQDGNVPSLSWKSHGYNPKTGGTWDMMIMDLPVDNAYQYSADVWSNIVGASVPNKYFQIGRLSHLIEDMAAPAHAHADMHVDGDDMETYSHYNYDTPDFEPMVKVRLPSTDGLSAQAGLPHPTMTTDNSNNFMRNVAWRTYYMTSYYGGNLVETEGDAQPDSELKRMFPYNGGTGLRYDDGGFFGNDYYYIDGICYNWIGIGIGINPDWWDCPGDSGYFYFENIDGDYDTDNPSKNGWGVAPTMFKKDKFRRILSSDMPNINTLIAPTSKILARIYCENLNPMAAEWVAGFMKFASDTFGYTKDHPEISVTGPGGAITDGQTTISAAAGTYYTAGQSYTFTVENFPNPDAANLVFCGSPKVAFTGPGAANYTATGPATQIAPGGSSTFTITFNQVEFVLSNEATVIIENNDPNEDPFDFKVNAGGNVIADAMPCYTWDTDPNPSTTHYEVRLKNSYYHNVFYKWYTDAEVNNGDGTCTACPNKILTDGTYYLVVRAKIGVNGTIWKVGSVRPFIVDTYGPPAKPTLISPTGSTDQAIPEFNWNTTPYTDDYQLKIQNAAQKNIFADWYSSSIVDDGYGVSTLLHRKALEPGSYYWMIRGRNRSGEGEWSNKMTFTVTNAQVPPAAPTLNTPSGTISQVRPEFDWDAPANADYYYLLIQNVNKKTIFKQGYAPATVDNGDGTCCISPKTLPPGDYYWLVRAKNEYGTGDDSPKKAFKIAP